MSAHLGFLFALVTACGDKGSDDTGGRGGDLDADGFEAPADCDDSDPLVHPAAVEVCNDRDDDCNGVTDDPGAQGEQAFYVDFDGDGVGADTVVLACTLPSGASESSGDCDDEDDGVYPGAEEVCDGLDQDCDEEADEGLAWPRWYEDGDEDGYGNTDVWVEDCAAPVGYVRDGGDCDDGDGAVHPGALELCNGLDDDCDGEPERSTQVWYYEDADGDSYGSDASAITLCEDPGAPWVGVGGDCADDDHTIHPGAKDPPYDGEDQDCSGGSDNDADGDGHDDEKHGGEDCDDSDPDAHPGAMEVCDDGDDDDCDGEVDSPCLTHGALGLADASAVVRGPGAGEQLGWALQVTRDVDGDGYDEILVGSPYADAGGSESGSAYLVEGPFDGVHDADEVAVATLIGDANTYSGASVAAGDIGGSGDVDFAVGAVTGAGGRGSVAVAFGPVSGTLTTGDVDVLFEGPATSAYLGVAVAIGDFDGDGEGDLAMGAPYHEAYSGSVFVAYGPLTGSAVLDDAVQLEGPADYSRLGERATNLGDLDGDGADELGLGCPSSSILYLVDGRATDGAVPDDRAVTIYKGISSALANQSAGGDVDGDGYGDLLVGAPYASESDLYSGALFVVHGPVTGPVRLDTDSDLVVTGTAYNEHFGYGVTAPRDVDGNGAADLLIGNEYHSPSWSEANRGAAYVFYGPLDGGTWTSVDAHLTLSGENVDDHAGATLGWGRFLSSTEDAMVVGSPQALGASSKAGDLSFVPVFAE